MWRSKLTWQHACCALALTGALIGTANTEVVAAPRADWCYNECGPEATCETECENDGGGTITCGDYHDGAPEWCNADNCHQVCWQNSPPSQECIWDNQSTTCYDYGVYGYCGDNVCSGITLGETCTNCEDDCLVCPSPIECDNEICESAVPRSPVAFGGMTFNELKC